MAKQKKKFKPIGSVKKNSGRPKKRKKKSPVKSIVPFGQVKLTNADFNRTYVITYKERKEKPGALPKYFNVRKLKMCKERNPCQILLELTPSVVYEHKAYPILSEPDVPVTYFRRKRKGKTKIQKKLKVNLDKSDSDFEGKEDNIDSSSDSVEEEKEEETQEIDIDAISGKIEEEDMGEEEELEMNEDMLSVPVFPHNIKTLEQKEDWSQVSMSQMIEMDAHGEDENVTPLPSWLDLTTVTEKSKSMFNYCENVTQTTNQTMETFCSKQSHLPQLTHVGGRFCSASAYDAYVMFRRYTKKDPKEFVMSMMDSYNEAVEDRTKRQEVDINYVDIDFFRNKLGRHDDRLGEQKEKVRDKNMYYEIDDLVASDDEIEITSESERDENAMMSSSDEGEEEPELGGDKDSDDEEKENIQEAKNTDDIDGYDLIPEDFFNPSADGTEAAPVQILESVPFVEKPNEKESKLRLILTTAQKEQIINHLINPFDNEAVSIEKDEVKDVNFDAADSDDDVADNGEYLLGKYGTVARDLQEGIGSFSSDELKSAEYIEKKKTQERDSHKIKTLRELLDKQKRFMDLKKCGGVIHQNQYVQTHANTKDGENDHSRGPKEKPNKNMSCKKDFMKEKKIPKRSKLIDISDSYQNENRIYRYYTDEYEKLTIVSRLIHHKQYCEIGWDFLVFEDNDDAKRQLFPLKKLPFFGSKDCRITHLCWMPDKKHNFVISYESLQYYASSDWHEGYIVFSYPLANTDYDHAYKFSCGVRYFDIAREKSNKGLMLVALEDGRIELVKIPFPNVIQSTTLPDNDKCPVEKVLWMLDWQETDGKLGFVRYQRFLSYATDGKLKLWWNHPSFGFTVYRTIRLYNLRARQLTPRHRRITCMGCHWYDRTLFYIGSEDGKIYKYNILYAVNTYDCVLSAHSGPVTTLAVNSFNRDIFLSGGADGMVKLWRGNSRTPICGYWLINPIVDIKWSPSMSYVWTVVTRDNFVHIYNLEQNFHDPMTSQHILPNSSCAKVDFHPIHQVLMIADNYCNLHAFKINRMALEPEVVANEDNWDAEVEDEAEAMSFAMQRRRLKIVVDNNEVLVKNLTRVNKGGIFERLLR